MLGRGLYLTVEVKRSAVIADEERMRTTARECTDLRWSSGALFLPST